MISGKAGWRSALHRADGGAITDIELHLALEFERTPDHRARSNDDPRRSRGAEAEPALVLVDEDTSLDSRVGSNVDVTRRRLDSAAHVSGFKLDHAVDIGQATCHVRTFSQGNAAVDQLDV